MPDGGQPMRRSERPIRIRAPVVLSAGARSAVKDQLVDVTQRIIASSALIEITLWPMVAS